MVAGPQWLQGNPELPYTRHLCYPGQDVLINCTFLTSLGVATQPSAISWQMDDLTNAQNMVGQTNVTPTGSSQVIQIPASALVMDRTYEGRQICQVTIAATIPDTNAPSGSITVYTLVIIELVAIATANTINSP